MEPGREAAAPTPPGTTVLCPSWALHPRAGLAKLTAPRVGVVCSALGPGLLSTLGVSKLGLFAGQVPWHTEGELRPCRMELLQELASSTTEGVVGTVLRP